MAQGFGPEISPSSDDVSFPGLPQQSDFIERDLTDPSQHWGSGLIRPDREELVEGMHLRPLRQIMGLDVEEVIEN